MIARFPIRIHCPRLLVSAFCLLMLVGLPLNGAKAESWTDLHGTRTIDARMVGLWGDSVLLEMTNGRRVSVNMNSLRSDSRIQARRLSKEIAARQVTRIGEMNQASIAAAASAPDPLPQPTAAPAYQPPPVDVEVDAFLNQVDKAIEAGHVRAVYDSLPPAYRADVDEVVRLAAAKADADGYESIVESLQELGSVLVTNQSWLLSSPRIQSLPESIASQVRGPLLSLASLAHATKDTDLFSLEKIKSQPFSQWLSEFDKASCDYFHQANQTSGKPILRSVEVESTRNEVTRVKIESGERDSTVSFTKVDGYWVPTSMDQEKWTTIVDGWKKKIDETDGMELLQPCVGYAQLLTSMLGPLSRTSNSNDFHAELESLIESLTPKLPTWAADWGIKLNFNPNDRRNNGYYGDEDF